jgi:hypothetical protein
MSEIERDLLASRPLVETLRKLILLGAHVSSPGLRDWASNELRGYANSESLPEYRVLAAPILMDAVDSYAMVRGQRVGVSELPDFAQDSLDESVELRMGLGEIEEMIRRNGGADRTVKLSVPGARELARIMQHEAPRPLHIDSLYWAVSAVTLQGLVEQVRNRLAELLAELRALTPRTQDVPSPEQAEQAVSIVIKGVLSRYTINTVVGGDQNISATSALEREGSDKIPFWTLGRRVAAIVVGAFTVAGSIAAVIAVL